MSNVTLKLTRSDLCHIGSMLPEMLLELGSKPHEIETGGVFVFKNPILRLVLDIQKYGRGTVIIEDEA